MGDSRRSTVYRPAFRESAQTQMLFSIRSKVGASGERAESAGDEV